MKKLVTLFLGLVLMAGMLCACGKGETSTEQITINGIVMDIEVENEDAKEEKKDNKKAKDIYLLSSTDIFGTGLSFTRDENGRITSALDMFYEYRFVYDDNNNITQVSKWHYEDTMLTNGKEFDEEARIIWDFTYDSEGKITTLNHSENGLWTYEYNDLGQLVRVSNPTYNDAVSYTYDDAGRTVLCQGYNYKGLDLSLHFTYDENGNVTLCTETDDEGKELARYEYTYDADNKLNSHITYDYYGSAYESTITYDENGLLTYVSYMGYHRYAPVTLSKQNQKVAFENQQRILDFFGNDYVNDTIYVSKVIDNRS